MSLNNFLQILRDLLILQDLYYTEFSLFLSTCICFSQAYPQPFFDVCLCVYLMCIYVCI